MVQRLRNLITVSCFAQPPLLPAGAPKQKGNANKSEINWTTKKRKKKKSMRPLTREKEGRVGIIIYLFFS